MKKNLNFLIVIMYLPIYFLCKKNIKKKKNLVTHNGIKNFIKSKIFPNSILMFELNECHYECLPGFTKYFIDLGYKVDIIMRKGQVDSMKNFVPREKIRIFKYTSSKKDIYNKRNYLKRKFRKYNFSLLLSTDESKFKKKYYKALGFYNNPNSLFIVHGGDFIQRLGLDYFIKKKHVFALADYGKLIYLNPNYFGNFKLNHQRNKKISFYITSTVNRYYSYLILGVRNLKNKLIDFEINVSGNSNEFNKKLVPYDLKKYFKFHGKISYSRLFSIVQKSDYIILNLFSNSKTDYLFRSFRATGSAQLSYGFNKPVLIEIDFAKIYKFSNENAIIFENHDLVSAMEKAVKISNEEYTKLCDNLESLRENIYKISLNNLRNVLK